MGTTQDKQGDNPTPSPEELKQEDEALKEANEEEVRTSIVEKYGLDTESQKDLVDKLVGDTLEQRKSFGKAIKQKREWRTKAQEAAIPPPVSTPAPSEVKPKPSPKKEDKGGLSGEDAIVLMNAGVKHLDDIEEIKKFAGYHKTSIGEALESKTLKTILAERKEERETAEATHTGTTRKGTSKVSDESLLEQADKGIFPDDPMELILARERDKAGKK